MVTHPEGGWEEGVVRSECAYLGRQGCAGGLAESSGARLRTAIQRPVSWLPARPGMPLGPRAGTEDMDRHRLVHRGRHQGMFRFDILIPLSKTQVLDLLLAQ